MRMLTNVESDRKYKYIHVEAIGRTDGHHGKNILKIVEFWFDGSWVKPGYRWPVEGIYRTIKSRERNARSELTGR